MSFYTAPKGRPLDLHWKTAGGGGHYVQPFEGIINNLERRYQRDHQRIGP